LPHYYDSQNNARGKIFILVVVLLLLLFHEMKDVLVPRLISTLRILRGKKKRSFHEMIKKVEPFEHASPFANPFCGLTKKIEAESSLRFKRSAA
jgi:hypothetical protein